MSARLTHRFSLSSLLFPILHSLSSLWVIFSTLSSNSLVFFFSINFKNICSHTLNFQELFLILYILRIQYYLFFLAPAFCIKFLIPFHLSEENFKIFNLKNFLLGFPGGAVVENLPANAGDMGSSPGPGRSHMPRSNWACAPQLLSLRVWSLCSATREATIVRGPRTAMKSSPRSLQLKKARAQQRRPNAAKNK